MRWRCETADDTECYGSLIAGARPRDDSLAVIYLTGDLGAGKTTLARGFLRALGVSGTVRSPSYGLMELYAIEAGTVLHLDLYRIHDASELETLGLREWAVPGVVWLVEWPELGGGLLPPGDLSIELTAHTGHHEINVSPRSAL